MNPDRKPLVSVVIPTYNRASLVQEAIDGVLSQTYPNIEVIVVDDGSTDDTLSQLQRYGQRIRVIAQENAGPAAARNRGIELSTGEYVAFLDSDDLWAPEKIERQFALLERAGPKVLCCLCNILMLWSTGDRASFEIAGLKPKVPEGIWLNVDEVLATRFVLFNQGALVRRQAFRQIGSFNDGLRLLEDYEFPLRLSLLGPWAYLAEPLVTWRETPGSCYQQAKDKEILTKRLSLSILELHRGNVSAVGNRPRLERLLQKHIEVVRHQLSAAACDGAGPATESVRGGLNRFSARLRRTLFTRSLWFPSMEIQTIDCWEAHNRDLEAGVCASFIS